jgi:hypothetical protein
MKTNTLLAGLAAGLVAVTFTACNKTPAPEATPAPATNAAKDMTAQAVDASKAMSEKLVDSAKDITAKAMNSVTDAAAAPIPAPDKFVTPKVADINKDAAAGTNVVSDTTFTEVVTATKKDLADKNYQNALTDLQRLSDVKLSDDQQKIVDGLKAEAQKMIPAGASSAMDAAKSLLGK